MVLFGKYVFVYTSLFVNLLRTGGGLRDYERGRRSSVSPPKPTARSEKSSHHPSTLIPIGATAIGDYGFCWGLVGDWDIT